jgi:hypothetical protein
MKLKKEWFILVAVIIGLSIYLFVRKQDRALYDLPQLPPVAGSEITRIEIAGPRANFVLNRDDKDWSIGDQKYAAANSKVQQMINTIEGLTLTELISTSGDKVRYDLTTDKKIQVKAWTGDTLVREFDIGKTAPSLRHTFVRIADNPNVYNARDNFRSKFDQELADLRDKQVLSFAVSEIQQVQVTRGSESMLLERRESALEQSDAQPADEAATAPVKAEMIWQTTQGVKADQARLDSFLTTLSQLSCDSYVADRSKKDFSSPIYHIRVKGAQDYELAIFDKPGEDADKHPAISSQNTYPFYLPDWQVKNLTPEFSELLQGSKPK